MSAGNHVKSLSPEHVANECPCHTCVHGLLNTSPAESRIRDSVSMSVIK